MKKEPRKIESPADFYYSLIRFYRFLHRKKIEVRLSPRETLYLVLRFYFGMAINDMIERENRVISKQAVNRVIMRAYRKIREAQEVLNGEYGEK
jgi:hypothetical protein